MGRPWVSWSFVILWSPTLCKDAGDLRPVPMDPGIACSRHQRSGSGGGVYPDHFPELMNSE